MSDGADTGPAPPPVSVVICAYTAARWQDTRDAVDSVLRQSQPPLETLLVVDHNKELHDAFATEYARTAAVRVLPNSGPRGLSAGRNTGIAASRGEVVAFLDDDAVAEREWLRRLTAPYADPAVLAVGGRTEPVWEAGHRPVWFPEEFDWTVGCMYRGHPAGRVRVRNVLGGNASFRRSAFEAVGGFETGIGRGGEGTAQNPRAGLPLGCEETELCIRLTTALPDAVLLVDDSAVIHHRVPADRARLGYLRRRAWAEGLSKAAVSRLVGQRAGLATERRYTTRVLPAGVGRGVRDALLGRPGGAGRAAAILTGAAAAAAGYAAGLARTAPGRRPGRPPSAEPRRAAAAPLTAPRRPDEEAA